MFSAPLYLLLTISIVGKCTDSYVVNNSASVKNVAKSETDDRRTAYFDSNNNNELDNHIRTSTINGTAIDNAIEMPKPNDAAASATAAVVDYLTYQTNKVSDDTLAAVETGKLSTQRKKLHFISLLRFQIDSIDISSPQESEKNKVSRRQTSEYVQ